MKVERPYTVFICESEAQRYNIYLTVVTESHTDTVTFVDYRIYKLRICYFTVFSAHWFHFCRSAAAVCPHQLIMKMFVLCALTVYFTHFQTFNTHLHI